MKIYDKQSLKQVYEVEIQALTENIQAMEKSIEVIQRFDGKVLNVRLKRRLMKLFQDLFQSKLKVIIKIKQRLNFTQTTDI